MSSLPEARHFLPIDLPLVRRLTQHGVCLDSATYLTRGVNAIEQAVWGAVPLADLGRPTFVLRNGNVEAVAQFRHKAGDQHAHVVFIAPDLSRSEDETAWLNLLDAMVIAAGRRGAVTLNAEIAETTDAFCILRQAGFSVYARQEIWKREPGTTIAGDERLLRPETDADAFAIHALFATVVPRLVLQADTMPEIGHGGLVYERDKRVMAYLLVQEGKCGVYIQSFIHPDCYDEVPAILGSALARISRVERLPVYFCLRRYQDWLRGTLDALGFSAWASQAVMVKHTAWRVEHPAFKTAYTLEKVKTKECVQVLPR
jgi:hypothetical protein